MNPRSGNISIQQGKNLDKSQSPYTLAVEVSDGRLKALGTVTVFVLSKPPPSFSQNLYTFTVDRNATEIGTVSASSTDANSSLIYSIASASTANASNTDIFAVNSGKGIISIGAGKSLAVSDSPYRIGIVASEIASPEISTQTTVLVRVRASYEVQTFRPAEDLGTLADSSLSIGTVNPGIIADTALSFALFTYTDVFEINSLTGELSLLENQCLDYSTNPLYELELGLLYGDVLERRTVTVQVQETPNRNLCGEIEGAVIDGTAKEYYFGGDGTFDNPYILPVSRCCEDFTFNYDQNYTTEAPLYYFRVNLIPGRYTFSSIKTEPFESGEPYSWYVTVRDEYQRRDLVYQKGFTNDNPVDSTISVNADKTIPTRGNHLIRITNEVLQQPSNYRWLSKKNFRFQR